MTVIAAAKNDKGELALIADRIYSPFNRPVWCAEPKIFRCDDTGYVLGVSGQIVNSGVLSILRGADDFFSVEIPPTDTHLILLTSMEVWIYRANDEKPAWYNPMLVGEPAAIGCFADMITSGMSYGDDLCLRQTTQRILALHQAYGFQSGQVDVMYPTTDLI